MGRIEVKILLLLIVFVLPACQNDGIRNRIQYTPLSDYNPGLSQGPAIRFDTTSYNFGKVYEGEKVGGYFKFKNIGNKDLVLLNVTTSCGCTIPFFSNEPVKPGVEGEVNVVFNTEGRIGYQHKTITVETNAKPEEIVLNIIAEVIEK